MNGIVEFVKAVALSPVGPFILAVAIDDVLGVALAVKSKTFDARKLGSFLVSQFGTKAAVALGGLATVAVIASLTAGSIVGLKDAAVAAVVAGSAALAIGVLADARDKAVALFK